MDVIQSLPTVESVLQLEPEELGGYLMETLSNTKAGVASDLHPGNLTSRVGSHYKDERVTDAILEAWAWLVREGLLVARKDGWYFIGKRGQQVKGRQDLDSFRRSNILPKKSLHPVIASAVWSNFILGKYETAVFEAFKEVEIAVRTAGGYQSTDIGTDLMGKAFNINSGSHRKAPRDRKSEENGEPITGGSFYKFESSKIVFSPFHVGDHGFEKAGAEGIGLLMVGDGGTASVGVLVEVMASVRADVYESVRFEGFRKLAGGDAFRDFQTVTTTAVDSISISGGTGFPS